jgi:hypothetical protein
MGSQWRDDRLVIRRAVGRVPWGYVVLEYDGQEPDGFYLFPNGFDKYPLREVGRGKWRWDGDRWRIRAEASAIHILYEGYGDSLVIHENALNKVRELLGYDPSIEGAHILCVGTEGEFQLPTMSGDRPLQAIRELRDEIEDKFGGAVPDDLARQLEIVRGQFEALIELVEGLVESGEEIEESLYGELRELQERIAELEYEKGDSKSVESSTGSLYEDSEQTGEGEEQAGATGAATWEQLVLALGDHLAGRTTPPLVRIQAHLEGHDSLLQQILDSVHSLLLRDESAMAAPGLCEKVRSADQVRKELEEIVPNFAALDSPVRDLLVDAERLRDVLDAHDFNDWTPVVNCYQRALELEAPRRLLKPVRRLLGREPGLFKEVRNRVLEGRDDFRAVRDILREAVNSPSLQELFRRTFGSAFDSVMAFQEAAQEFWALRNRASHDGMIPRKQAEYARERALGLGRDPGLFPLLISIESAPT